MNPHIVGVVETWLKREHTDGLIMLSDYVIYRYNRNGRGGIMLAIKKLFTCVQFDTPDCIELLALDIIAQAFLKLRLICVYIPQSRDVSYVRNLLCTLSKLITISFPYYIFGDFNFPNICWTSYLSMNSQTEKEFIEFLLKHQPITQTISFPTRGSHILDLLLTYAPQSIFDLKLNDPSGKSDHISIVGTILCPHLESRNKTITFLNFESMDINKISDYLNFKLINVYSIKSPSVAWWYFWKVICNCLTSCINRTSITHHNNRFISRPLKSLYNKMHKAYHMWCKRRNTSYYTKYKHEN